MLAHTHTNTTKRALSAYFSLPEISRILASLHSLFPSLCVDAEPEPSCLCFWRYITLVYFQVCACRSVCACVLSVCVGVRVLRLGALLSLLLLLTLLLLLLLFLFACLVAVIQVTLLVLFLGVASLAAFVGQIYVLIMLPLPVEGVLRGMLEVELISLKLEGVKKRTKEFYIEQRLQIINASIYNNI